MKHLVYETNDMYSSTKHAPDDKTADTEDEIAQHNVDDRNRKAETAELGFQIATAKVPINQLHIEVDAFLRRYEHKVILLRTWKDVKASSNIDRRSTERPKECEVSRVAFYSTDQQLEY